MFEKVWQNMFEGGSLWAGVITGGFAQLNDTVALKNGKMQMGDYAVSSTKNVTMALGTMAGVECGAILGSVLLPGVGTMIGSMVGGIVGDRLGSFVGQQAGTMVFKTTPEANRDAQIVPAS